MSIKLLDAGLFGPIVILIRVTFDGETHREFLDAPVAICKLLDDPDNGDVYCKGWINWNLEKTNARSWDMSP